MHETENAIQVHDTNQLQWKEQFYSLYSSVFFHLMINIPVSIFFLNRRITENLQAPYWPIDGHGSIYIFMQK